MALPSLRLVAERMVNESRNVPFRELDYWFRRTLSDLYAKAETAGRESATSDALNILLRTHEKTWKERSRAELAKELLEKIEKDRDAQFDPRTILDNVYLSLKYPEDEDTPVRGMQDGE